MSKLIKNLEPLRIDPDKIRGGILRGRHAEMEKKEKNTLKNLNGKNEGNLI
jgi:hypothetical protein